MIGYLEGKVRWKTKNKVIINVRGTGYLVFVSDQYQIPQKEEQISLYIYTYVREDTFDLYGFSSMKERELFDILLSVSRVGPKAGMNVLSTLKYDEFIKAILTEKITVLKQVSGIGPKTAKRLILELQGKIEDLGQEFRQTGLPGEDTNDDLYEALNSLGYSQREIDRVLPEIDFAKQATLEEKIKQTLSYLGKENV